MSSVTVKPSLDVPLPADLCRRYGIAPETPLRIVETRTGILLIPLTSRPPDAELAQELAEWQQLAASGWEAFPYEE